MAPRKFGDPKYDAWKEVFFKYTVTRRGLSTVHYDMIEGMMVRAKVFKGPQFTASTLRREFTKKFGPNTKMEIEFPAFDEFLEKSISDLYAKAYNCSIEEAYDAIIKALDEHKPADTNDKVIKTF